MKLSEDSEQEQADQNGYVGYRCYLLGIEGRIRKRIELKVADDSAALSLAQAELDRSTFPMAEVWYLKRKIGDVCKAEERLQQ